VGETPPKRLVERLMLEGSWTGGPTSVRFGRVRENLESLGQQLTMELPVVMRMGRHDWNAGVAERLADARDLLDWAERLEDASHVGRRPTPPGREGAPSSRLAEAHDLLYAAQVLREDLILGRAPDATTAAVVARAPKAFQRLAARMAVHGIATALQAGRPIAAVLDQAAAATGPFESLPPSFRALVAAEAAGYRAHAADVERAWREVWARSPQRDPS